MRLFGNNKKDEQNIPKWFWHVLDELDFLAMKLHEVENPYKYKLGQKFTKKDGWDFVVTGREYGKAYVTKTYGEVKTLDRQVNTGEKFYSLVCINTGETIKKEENELGMWQFYPVD